MPVEKRLCAFFAFRSQVTNAQRMWLCWDDLAARWAATWAKFQFVWKEGPSTMCSHSLPNPKPQFGNEAVLKATPQKLKPWKKARQHSAAHLLLILGSSKGCQLHQLQELAHSCLGSGPGLRLAAKLCTHPVCQSDVHRNGNCTWFRSSTSAWPYHHRKQFWFQRQALSNRREHWSNRRTSLCFASVSKTSTNDHKWIPVLVPVIL